MNGTWGMGYGVWGMGGRPIQYDIHIYGGTGRVCTDRLYYLIFYV